MNIQLRSFLIAVGVTALYFIAAFTLLKPHPYKLSGAYQSLQLWEAQRAYPKKTVSDAVYFAAFASNKKNETLKKISADSWRAIGPHNIGGRTLAVAINPQNPNTIYAGSASGGLWRSTTEGRGDVAWEYISTGFPVLGVSSIAIVPNDSNTIYIGTGEVYGYRNALGGVSVRTTRGSYGIGILKTTDNGVTWKKCLDWSQFEERGVNVIRIHPQFTNQIWAGTSEGVYRSTDAGLTWFNVHSVTMAMDIVLHPSDTNIVYATCGGLGSPGNGIYRSGNAGKNWTKLTNGLPASFGGKALLHMYPQSPNVLLASIGNGAEFGTWLCKTTDGGDSWTTVSTNDYTTYQGWYSHFALFHPNDSSKILCAGVDVYKSLDGGITQTQKSYWYKWYFGTPYPGDPEGPLDYSHADHHAFAIHPTNPDIVYLGGDGGVFCTTDFGESFEGRNGGYQTTQFYNGFTSAVQDSATALGGMQDNATAIYQGSVAWYRVIGGDGCMTGMSPTSVDTMYGTSQNLNLLRSTNRGINWTNISVPSGGTTNFVGPFVVAPSAPKILYAGRSKIFRSTTGGGNWTATNNNQVLDGNPVMMITVSPNDANVVYATTTPLIPPAHVFLTTNGGSTWTNITGTLPDRYLIDIAVHPHNDSIAYITASGFGTSHLFKTTNRGTDWIDIGAGLPDVPTSSVAIDPFSPNHIYAGNDLGVFLSTNDGNSWQQFSDGLPDAINAMDLSISPMNRSIRVATHGNGVFERKLYSTTTSVLRENIVVDDYLLEQNYPNPFNPVTEIKYQIPVTGQVTLKVYDSNGKMIATLVNEVKDRGAYSVKWNAVQFSSGVYFATLRAGGFSATKKLVYLR